MDKNVLVAEAENMNPALIACDADGNLQIEAVHFVYPEAVGLIYHNGRHTTFIARENQKLIRPTDGWGKLTYYCVFKLKDGKKQTDGRNDTTAVPIETDLKPETKTLRVWGLSSDTTTEMLKNYFSNFGVLQLVQVKINATSKKCEGCIRFSTQEEQIRVLLQNHVVNGCRIVVAVAGDESASISPERSKTTTPLSGAKKNKNPTISKSELINRIMDHFINNEVPRGEYRHQATRLVGCVVKFVADMEHDFEDKKKKWKAIDDIVSQRSMIEISEVIYMKRITQKDISGIPRDERWRSILGIKCDLIQSLRDGIDADPLLTIQNFPDYVCRAYRHLSRRIHDHVRDERKLGLVVDVDQYEGLFLGHSAMKRAIRLLLVHCLSPQCSPQNSNNVTPDLRKSENVTPVLNAGKVPEEPENSKAAIETGKYAGQVKLTESPVTSADADGKNKANQPQKRKKTGVTPNITPVGNAGDAPNEKATMRTKTSVSTPKHTRFTYTDAGEMKRIESSVTGADPDAEIETQQPQKRLKLTPIPSPKSAPPKSAPPKRTKKNRRTRRK